MRLAERSGPLPIEGRSQAGTWIGGRPDPTFGTSPGTGTVYVVLAFDMVVTIDVPDDDDLGLVCALAFQQANFGRWDEEDFPNWSPS